MTLSDLFEVNLTPTKLVWSKRGKDVEKRVERKASNTVQGRTRIVATKDSDANP